MFMSGSLDWNRISKDSQASTNSPGDPSITKMFLVKFSIFLFRSQKLNSKIQRDFRKILCPIALLIS